MADLKLKPIHMPLAGMLYIELLAHLLSAPRTMPLIDAISITSNDYLTAVEPWTGDGNGISGRISKHIDFEVTGAFFRPCTAYREGSLDRAPDQRNSSRSAVDTRLALASLLKRA